MYMNEIEASDLGFRVNIYFILFLHIRDEKGQVEYTLEVFIPLYIPLYIPNNHRFRYIPAIIAHLATFPHPPPSPLHTHPQSTPQKPPLGEISGEQNIGEYQNQENIRPPSNVTSPPPPASRFRRKELRQKRM